MVSKCRVVLVGFKPDVNDHLVSFSALILDGHQACKNRPRNDLLRVEWDVTTTAACMSTCMSTCECLCVSCRDVSGEASVFPVDIRFSHEHHG